MMLMTSTIVVGLMMLLSVLAGFAGRTDAQRFRGGTHGEERSTARRMELITPPSDALADVDAHAIEYYDDEDDHDDELALRGGGQRALTEKSKSKKSKSKSKKSKSKTEKSKKSKSDKGTKSTKKSKSEKKSDKGTKSTKKSKSEKGTKSTKKSKSKSKSTKSKSRKSMTQRAAVLDRLQILNGGGVSTSLANTNPQLQTAGLAGRSTGLGLLNLLDHNDEMDVFGQKLPRANTNTNNDNAAAAETTTLSKLAQLAAAAF